MGPDDRAQGLVDRAASALRPHAPLARVFVFQFGPQEGGDWLALVALGLLVALGCELVPGLSDALDTDRLERLLAELGLFATEVGFAGFRKAWGAGGCKAVLGMARGETHVDRRLDELNSEAARIARRVAIGGFPLAEGMETLLDIAARNSLTTASQLAGENSDLVSLKERTT